MVLLTPTPRILEAINSLDPLAHSRLQSSSNDPLPQDVASPISHKTIIALARFYRGSNARNTSTNAVSTIASQDDKALPTKSDRSANVQKDIQPRWTLDYLLRNTRPYIAPPPPKPAPSPEFTALMKNLRLQAERKQYLKMLSENEQGVHCRRHEQEEQNNSADETEEDPITPSLVLNIFLSVILSGLAVFQLSRWWGDEAARVLLSFFAAVVVGVAEVVVYAAYVQNIKRSRKREKSRKEKKVVLGRFEDPGNGDGISTGASGSLAKVYDGNGREVVIDPEYLRRRHEKKEDGNDQDGVVEVSEDVIWGKGKHGGMRRRVREKWEKDQLRERDIHQKDM